SSDSDSMEGMTRKRPALAGNKSLASRLSVLPFAKRSSMYVRAFNSSINLRVMVLTAEACAFHHSHLPSPSEGLSAEDDSNLDVSSRLSPGYTKRPHYSRQRHFLATPSLPRADRPDLPEE